MDEALENLVVAGALKFRLEYAQVKNCITSYKQMVAKGILSGDDNPLNIQEQVDADIAFFQFEGKLSLLCTNTICLTTLPLPNRELEKDCKKID